MQAHPNIVTLTLNPALDMATSVAKVVAADKLRCAEPRFDPGGGGVNVARVVQRLGGSAAAVYPQGGPTGERLTALLRAEGAPAAPVAVSGETRQSVHVTDRSDSREYRFVLPGPHLTAAELTRCLDAAIAIAGDGAFLVVSGSLPPGAPASILGDAARRAGDAGLRLVVDTSGPALAAALKAGVYLVKPNLRELSDHLNRPLVGAEDRLAACQTLISTGAARMVALSQGGDGALLATADGVWAAPAVPIVPLSTVGAGDTFLGGLVWALSSGQPPAEALRSALAAAAATLLSAGTGLCTAADMHRLLPQVIPVRVR